MVPESGYRPEGEDRSGWWSGDGPANKRSRRSPSTPSRPGSVVWLKRCFVYRLVDQGGPVYPSRRRGPACVCVSCATSFPPTFHVLQQPDADEPAGCRVDDKSEGYPACDIDAAGMAVGTVSLRPIPSTYTGRQRHHIMGVLPEADPTWTLCPSTGLDGRWLPERG